MKVKTADRVSGLIIGGLAGLLFIAGIAGVGNIGPTRKACEIYRGWTRGADGEKIFVFDPKKRDERGLDVQYPLVGDAELENSLKIGNKYCFEYKDPIAPWATKRLVSAQECQE